MALTGGGSALFSGFRALGLYSNHVPHALHVHAKHREFYLSTAAGNRVHAYNVNKLGIVAVSNALPADVSCLAADRMLVFAACGQEVYALARNKEVVHVYRGAHEADVHVLLSLGDQLVSGDKLGTLVVWDVQSAEEYLRLHFDPATFDLSALLHPSTFLNKVLLGSHQGALQLWNIKTSKLLYTFPGWSSPVTALEQSPAVDVVGIGLASGRVVLLNIRTDTELLDVTQDLGPVTSLSFRTDGPPVMAASSPQGSVAFWDLEDKRLVAHLTDAHHSPIAAATFVHRQPLLVTNGSDNAIKVWTFDQGGGARLLRSREGHRAPPTFIRHHGYDGHNILSAGQDGTLRSFSTVHERFNKSLGHGCVDKKKNKKKGNNEKFLLPAITCFSCESAREADWDGVVALHRGEAAARTWNFQRCTMGKHLLAPPPGGCTRPVHATAVDITSCGNFAVVGSSSGQLDVYNLQSGLHRGCYGELAAHMGAVRGVHVDALNQRTWSAGAGDRLLHIWGFRTRKLTATLTLAASPARTLLHRDSGMLALALDDLSLVVVDTETSRVVRTFQGHRAQITDMTFSPDGRWLISCSMDCSIRTWDLPSACLVDCFLVEAAPVSISMATTGDFLATAHVDTLGVVLWSNRSLCGPVWLRPLPADFQPETLSLPGSAPSPAEDPHEGRGGAKDQIQKYEWPEQLEPRLLTLTALPAPRWRNLLHLDTIKRRNKPPQPPLREPGSAPFFLPTLPGLTPTFTLETEERSQVVQSKLVSALEQKSEFCVALETNRYHDALSVLKLLPPSRVDVELRLLLPDWGSAPELSLAFIRMIDAMLSGRRDFDLAQAYLALFLKLHLRAVSRDPVAMAALQELLGRLEAEWAWLQDSFNQSLCVLAYAKSALL